MQYLPFSSMRIPDLTYEENVDYLKSWLSERYEWLCEYWGVDAEGAADSESEENEANEGDFIYEITTDVESTVMTVLSCDTITSADSTNAVSGVNIAETSTTVPNTSLTENIPILTTCASDASLANTGNNSVKIIISIYAALIMAAVGIFLMKRSGKDLEMQQKNGCRH